MDAGNPTKRVVLALGVAALALILAAPAVSAAPKNELVTQSSGGAMANGDSWLPDVSADGKLVVFMSEATNLVANDKNGRLDIFLRNMATGKVSLISKSSKGVRSDGDSTNPTISADGRFVAFFSGASNLIDGKHISDPQIYVRDRKMGKTKLISKNLKGVPGNQASDRPVISADGAWIAYESRATNLTPKKVDGCCWQIFATHRKTGVTFLKSKNNKGQPGNDDSTRPTISGNGRFVAFESDATNLGKKTIPHYGEQVYLRDGKAKKTMLISKNSKGKLSNGDADKPTISDSGRYVVFTSEATNIDGPDKNGSSCDDLYIRDRKAGTTRIVSRYKGKQSNGPSDCSGDSAISGNSRYVAWEDDALWMNSGYWEWDDVFVKDLATGKIKRVTNEWNSSKAAGGSDPALSGNGLYLVFEDGDDTVIKGGDNGHAHIYRTKTR